MTSIEAVTPVPYLEAPRDHRLSEAILHDWELLATQSEETGNVPPLDVSIGIQGSLDLEVTQSLGAWEDGDVVPRRVRKYRRQNLETRLRAQEEATAINLDFIDAVGYDETVHLLGEFSILKMKSRRYPNWNPTALEMWIRQGPTFAALPLFKELLGRKRQPVTDPSNDAVVRTSLDLAVTSQTLRTVQDDLLRSPWLAEKPRHFIRSLGGLLLEYDALLALYEDREHVQGYPQWHLPTPPNMDYGRNSQVKGDIVSYYFNTLNPRNITYNVYDVKSRHTPRHKDTPPLARLSGVDIGCTRFDKGQAVTVPGLRCDDFLESYVENFGDLPGYDTPRERLARGMSIVGTSLPYLHLTLHAVSKHRHCSMPAPYRPEDSPQWIDEPVAN